MVVVASLNLWHLGFFLCITGPLYPVLRKGSKLWASEALWHKERASDVEDKLCFCILLLPCCRRRLLDLELVRAAPFDAQQGSSAHADRIYSFQPAWKAFGIRAPSLVPGESPIPFWSRSKGFSLVNAEGLSYRNSLHHSPGSRGMEI